jgi:pimeloyl-ACP methyl ester carboxylesterase
MNSTSHPGTASSALVSPDPVGPDPVNSHPVNQDPETPETRFLSRPKERIGYDVAGSGPLVVLVPGMGDLRSTYRFVAPALRDGGFRVACTDLRGHGDSDATFESYGDEETASDVIALIEELGGPAVVVGNSMAAGAGVLVAADRPELVAGLVLVGPFVRNAEMGAMKAMMLRVAMAPLWAAASWKSYMPKLYAGRRPADFAEYRKSVVASLHKPGYAKAFSLTTRTNHDPAQARLADVSAPTMVLMGEKDPDFADPAGEASWVAAQLDAAQVKAAELKTAELKTAELKTAELKTAEFKTEVVMVPEAGHYPQSQQPETTAAAMLRFARAVTKIA